MRDKHCVADGVSRVGQKTSTNTSVLKWFFLLVLLNVTNARVVALNEMFVFLARGIFYIQQSSVVSLVTLYTTDLNLKCVCHISSRFCFFFYGRLSLKKLCHKRS